MGCRPVSMGCRPVMAVCTEESVGCMPATGGCRPVTRGCGVVNRVGRVIRGGCAAENEREAANCHQGRGAPPTELPWLRCSH